MSEVHRNHGRKASKDRAIRPARGRPTSRIGTLLQVDSVPLCTSLSAVQGRSPEGDKRRREAKYATIRNGAGLSQSERGVDTMRTMTRISLLVFALAATALGQSRIAAGPPTAASGPGFAVSAGYTYIAMPIPTAERVNLNGVDVSGHVDLAYHLGVTADSSYVRASDVFGTGHNSYVMTALAGPVFYPIERRNIRLFVHALVGAGLVDSAVPVSGTRYVGGWVARFADAVGGGVEHSISGPFAVRVGGDYLRTSFVDSNSVAHPQNNFRATVSLLVHIRDRERRD